MVGNAERNVVGVDLLQAPRWLVQAGCDFQGLRLVLCQQLPQKNQGQAGIQNIFDQDHVAAPDRSIQVLDQSSRVGGLYPLVAGDGHEVESRLDRDAPRQVGKKDRGSLQHSYQQNGLTCEVAAYLRADFRYPGSDLLAPEQHLMLKLSHWRILP